MAFSAITVVTKNLKTFWVLLFTQPSVKMMTDTFILRSADDDNENGYAVFSPVRLDVANFLPKSFGLVDESIHLFSISDSGAEMIFTYFM